MGVAVPPDARGKPRQSGDRGCFRLGSERTRGVPRPGSSLTPKDLASGQEDSPRKDTMGKGHTGELRLKGQPGSHAGSSRDTAPVCTLPAPTRVPRLPPSPPRPPPRPPERGRSRAHSSRRPSPSSCSSRSKRELRAGASGSALLARVALNPLRSRGAGSRSPAAAAFPPPLAAAPAPAALTRWAPERQSAARAAGLGPAPSAR